MGRTLASIALYLVATTSASAYGSIAAGSNGSSLSFTASADEQTAQRAETDALQHCRNIGLQSCAVRESFHNTCLAIGLNGGYLYRFGSGPTPFQAQQNMIASCVLGHVGCTWVMTACDTSPAPAARQPAESVHNQLAQASVGIPPDNDGQLDTAAWAGIGALFAFLRRYWLTFFVLATFAATVISVSFLRLAVSVVSAAPRSVLKERALICAWVSFPPAVAAAGYYWLPNWLVSIVGPIFLLAWTDAFGALALGGMVRKRLSTDWKAPGPLSLPLASFGFGTIATVPLLLYWSYGGLTSSSCGLPPLPILSICEFLAWQGAYYTAAILFLIFLGGVFLPADSNLIVAQHLVGKFLRKSLVAPRPGTSHRASGVEPSNVVGSGSRIELAVAPKTFPSALDSFAEMIVKETGPVTSSEQHGEAALAPTAPASSPPAPQSAGLPVPVPDIPAARAPKGIVLKLKRSQRSSFSKKIIFVLDARIQLTAEEGELIGKYRLYNDVVYESANRKARNEATLAHLEMTASSKTSFRDSTGTQMLGVGKTFYRLARAGISATAAALSLRITISSLIGGVHVECKSMAELMEAEAAIIEAARNVRDYLDLAETFDGREEILEF